jgi:hypothetical protein
MFIATNDIRFIEAASPPVSRYGPLFHKFALDEIEMGIRRQQALHFIHELGIQLGICLNQPKEILITLLYHAWQTECFEEFQASSAKCQQVWLVLLKSASEKSDCVRVTRRIWCQCAR